jgi:hypothetical protein
MKEQIRKTEEDIELCLVELEKYKQYEESNPLVTDL